MTPGKGEARDPSLDAVLNGIRLPDGTVVAWAVAFPRNYEVICKREVES